MKNPLGGGNGMVPHYSGTTLDAQARYAAGTKDILENYFTGKAQEPANIIVGKGEYATKACAYLPALFKPSSLTFSSRWPTNLKKCIFYVCSIYWRRLEADVARYRSGYASKELFPYCFRNLCYCSEPKMYLTFTELHYMSLPCHISSVYTSCCTSSRLGSNELTPVRIPR